jgi:flagellar hook assembly protein FlgD
MTVVTFKLYNAAGEVVKTLRAELVPDSYGDIAALEPRYGTGKGSYDPGLGLLTIAVRFKEGEVLITWDGTNDMGIGVTNGEYLLKAEYWKDKSDSRMLTVPIVVLRGSARLRAAIYTASGELVRVLYESGSVSNRLVAVELSDHVLTIGGPAEKARIEIKPIGVNGMVMMDSAGALDAGRISWEGKNAGGWMVQSGEYLLKVEEIVGGDKITIVESITVVRIVGPDGVRVGVYPNPVHGGSGAGVVKIAVTVAERSETTVRIYNVAGELVGTIPAGTVPAGTTTLEWQVSSMASGVYIGLVETRSLETGDREKKTVKIVIVK